MTAIPDNVKITKNNAVVIIGVERVVENWTKTVNSITPPKGTAQQSINDGKNPTKFIDLLLKAEQRLTFDGFIYNEATNRALNACKDKSNPPNTITDATDILDTMRDIFFAGGVFTINWNGTDYTVNSDKFESTWSVNDRDTISSYRVKFTVIVGEDI